MTGQQPAPQTPRTGRRAYRGGWQQAVQLYAALAHGQPLPTVLAPDFAGGAVYLDVPFTYARFFAMDVTYQPGGMVVIGSPGFVAGAAIGRLIGTSIGYARAASLSRRQWRGHQPARVVVTATSTWCQVGGRWICFDHRAVLDYQIDGGQACVMAFADTVSVRLYGPSAGCHAVLYAYLRHGPGFHAVPFLHPIRQAVQHIAGFSQ
jgi:hypothetical protein